MVMGEQKRHWLLTVHDEHLKKWEPHGLMGTSLEQVFAECKAVRYACGQLEKCPETGTLHHQIYVEFGESLRLSQVTKLFPSHAESRLGTRTDAREYCTSDTYRGKDKGQIGESWEVGHWRQDIAGRSETQKARIIRYIVAEGLTPEGIALCDPEAFFSHYRAIRALYMARQGTWTLDD
jgi:hypothetical protein